MMASSSVSPATKRRAMRRVVGLEVTQRAKPGLSESFSRVARSMKLHYACEGDSLLGQHFFVVLFQELFSVQGGHAAGAGGGDRLAIAMVLHIAGDENAGDGRLAAIQGNKVAVGIHFELAAEDNSVGVVADSDKDTIKLNLGSDISHGIAQAHTADVSVGVRKNLVDHRGRHEFDFFIGPCAIEHDFGSAKLRAAMNEIDLAGVAGQEDGLFHRGISAAYHGYWFAAEKVSVACSARGNAVAHEVALGRKPEEARRGARGNDQRLGFIRFLAGDNLKRAAAEDNFTHRARFEFGAEPFRLLAHVVNQLGPQNTLGETGVIFNHGGQGELAAGFVAIDHQGLEVGASGIDCGGESGAAAANDDDVMHSRAPSRLDSPHRPAGTAKRYCSIVTLSPPFPSEQPNWRKSLAPAALTPVHRCSYISGQKVALPEGEGKTWIRAI